MANPQIRAYDVDSSRNARLSLTVPAISGELVEKDATQTLTAKTLTSPNLVTPQIGGVNLTAGAAELNLVDGSAAGTILNSKAVVYGAAGEVNATSLEVGGAAITATPAELNILDGVTAVTAELNYLDIATLGTVASSKAWTSAAGGTTTLPGGQTLDVSAGTLTLADNQISGDKVEGGTIAAITITAATITQLAAALDCNNENLTNVDIDSGAIDGTTVGGSTAAAGTFTTLTANTSLVINGSSAMTAIETTLVGSSAKLADANAIKVYVDAVAAGLRYKDSVVNATTANVTLSGEQTIDGVLTSAGRILVKDQTDATENGIYVTGAGAWSRSTDADTDAEVLQGMTVFVESGTVNGTTLWAVTTDTPDVGDADLDFTQVGGIQEITDGTGLSKSGQVLSVDASLTHVTAVGTIGTGVWQGTAIADTYLATISTANKVDVGAIDIDGATEMGAALADADLFIVDDGGAGTEKSMLASRIPTYLNDHANLTTLSGLTTAAALVTVSALDSGSITSGFGNIDNGASNITSGGLWSVDVDADADDYSADSATGRLTIGLGGDINLYHGGTNSYLVNSTGAMRYDVPAASDHEFSVAGVEVAQIDETGISLATGDSYQINGANTLNATTLGAAVLASSLTSLGTITSLVATTADINDGTVDAVIGGTAPKAGTFTTATFNTSFTMNDAEDIVVTEISATLDGTSDATLLTEGAIKTYVDTQVQSADTFFELSDVADSATGDMFWATSGTPDTLNNLTIGAAGTVMVSTGSAPSWSATVGGLTFAGEQNVGTGSKWIQVSTAGALAAYYVAWEQAIDVDTDTILVKELCSIQGDGTAGASLRVRRYDVSNDAEGLLQNANEIAIVARKTDTERFAKYGEICKVLCDDPGAVVDRGVPVWASENAGKVSVTPPSTSGKYHRVIGYTAESLTNDSNPTEMHIRFWPEVAGELVYS
jgi:hypothetical protein